jgi:hypothetical protein
LAGQKHHISKLWMILVFQMWYERWIWSAFIVTIMC